MDGSTRNDPCPCGSGRKYKRCCWADHAAAQALAAPAALPDADLDFRVGSALAAWVAQRDPEGVRRVQSAVGERTRRMPAGEAVGLVTSLTAYELAAPDGRRWVEAYREREGAALPAEDRRYLDAQVEAWFSVWEVLSVRPGEGFVLRDLLTGEERDVRERMGSSNIAVRHALCGRIVRRGLHFTYGAGSPFILPPRAAQEAVDAVRRALEPGQGRGRVAPARLQGPAALQLVRAWADAVERGFAPRPAQRLANTDGDVWQQVRDRCDFAPADRDAVLAALGRIAGAEGDEAAGPGEEASVTLTRPGNAQHPAWTNTVVAHVRVGPGSLVVETNSVRRADGAAATVRGALGSLVGPFAREQATLEEAAARERREPRERRVPPLPDGERQRIVRELKGREYAAWPDLSVPALGGRTPREVARNRRLLAFRELELILKDMEQAESRQPLAERFDVGILRRELGMDA